MNRKDFIRMSSLGLAGLAFSSFDFPETENLNNIYKASYDALIVGTGYGGAVAALRLAEKGHRVLLIEMGLDWQNSGLKFSKLIWPTKESTWLKRRSIMPFGNFRILPRFTGALDRMEFDHVKVYAGRGVGGGSLVNGGMSVTPKRSYFESVFPDLNAQEFYDRWFPLANQELSVTTIPEDQYQSSSYYAFSRRGEEEAHKAGFKTVRVPNVYDFDYMKREEAGEVPKSALGGEVIFGNNYGKKDLTKTYLKKALATGKVQLLPLHRAHHIAQTPQGCRLHLERIDTSGKVIDSPVLETKNLFLAAGTMGTTELLQRSIYLKTLQIDNPEIGQQWGNNGNVMAGRNFIKGGTGKQQSTIPAAAIDNWDDTEHSFFTEIAPLPLSLEVWAGLYLSINRVPKTGKLVYDPKADRSVPEWGPENTAHMLENSKYFINKMNEANGGTFARLLFDKGIATDICYHPLGGCIIGKATDYTGEVRGAKGLYVTDGSLIPGTIGVNPYVTITAIAEYIMDGLLKKGLRA